MTTTINETKIRPIGDMILVRPLDPAAKTTGGIIIPSTTKEQPLMGRILAVGRGRPDDRGKLRALPVKKDETVYYNRYAGTEIKTSPGNTVILMSCEDVLGVQD